MGLPWSTYVSPHMCESPDTFDEAVRLVAIGKQNCWFTKEATETLRLFQTNADTNRLYRANLSSIEYYEACGRSNQSFQVARFRMVR